MIASDRRKIGFEQQVGGARRLERATHQIAQVEGHVGALRLDILEHRLEREAVRMNVGDDGDAHRV
jgi:hypothetical protein